MTIRSICGQALGCHRAVIRQRRLAARDWSFRHEALNGPSSSQPTLEDVCGDGIGRGMARTSTALPRQDGCRRVRPLRPRLPHPGEPRSLYSRRLRPRLMINRTIAIGALCRRANWSSTPTTSSSCKVDGISMVRS